VERWGGEGTDHKKIMKRPETTETLLLIYILREIEKGWNYIFLNGGARGHLHAQCR
jgi:hypothetical protein